MLEDLAQEFADSVFLFLTGKRRISKNMLVKRHTENFQSHGDFSFVNTIKSWHQYVHVGATEEDNLLKAVGKNPGDLASESKSWVFSVAKAKEEKDRVYLHLDRPKAIKVGLLKAVTNIHILNERLEKGDSIVECDPLCTEVNNITYLRLSHLVNTVKNLCSVYSGTAPDILVTYKSSSKTNGDNHRILCGVVLNSKTGLKEDAITGSDFISLRQNEMLLIAQHKYGVRVSTENKWKEYIDCLGESAVAFEMLQIKPSSPIKINFDNAAAGSSKGASFVLYNCARLETMLRTFYDRVEDGTYPPLPDMDQVDFGLLTNEEEWNLIFNYIISLPSLLESCVDLSGDRCEFRPHNICTFLSNLVRIFSQYYRRVRILTEPRKHLLPVLFARVHMLRILNDTLKICLRIINIRTVTQM